MAKQKAKYNGYNVKAVVSNLKIDSGTSKNIINGIIPYGELNNYPNEVFEAIRLSPTAKGCVKRTSEYTYGKGIENNGEMIVNRWGQTLNQVFFNSIYQKSWLGAFSLHFNFNLFGLINEITCVDIRYLRKTKDLLKARIDLFNNRKAIFASGKKEDIFLYNYEKLKEQIKLDGGFDIFKGNIYYYTNNDNIYTLSTGDASLPSAQLENEVQVYNFASINNSFSGSGIVKLPFKQNDGNQRNEIENELQRMTGAGNAGGKMVIELPLDASGNMQNLNLFESFQQNNIDKMFVEQVKNAENNILKEYTMPKILLGISENGMFNQASFQDASDYFNSSLEGERIKMQDSFNKFWDKTIFYDDLKEIKIVPLDMFNNGRENKNDESNSNTNT